MWLPTTSCRLLLLSLGALLAARSAAGQNHHMRSDWNLHDNEYVLAYINVTYGDPGSGALFHQGGEIGKFSTGLVAGARGRLVHVRSRNGTAHHGCDDEWENALPPAPQPWVALIQRGLCNFDVKVENAYRQNASAVVIYDYKEGDLHRIHLTRRHKDTIVTVFIPKAQGDDLAHITDSGIDVLMQITPGKHFSYSINNLNKTSVLFVSVSFILLMVISLAWLLFYYVQRFRYIHTRDQLTKRLVCAARKAVSRIPVTLLKGGDEQLTEGECCAVCLEPYQVSDQLRSLPCSHEFHKQCVDPWLLKNRTCPMCKMDILKFFGLSAGSEESIVQMELEAVSVAQRRDSALSPVLYVSGPPSAGLAAARSRAVSRTSLQSMSLVMPSPACVESLYSRGPGAAGGGSTARCRRVSAVLGGPGGRPEPPRRSSAPTRRVTGTLLRESLGRSLSSPAGPATSVAVVAGSLVATAYDASRYGDLSPQSGALQTAMCRRCQRPGRADARSSPQQASCDSSHSSDIAEGPSQSCSSSGPSQSCSSSGPSQNCSSTGPSQSSSSPGPSQSSSSPEPSQSSSSPEPSSDTSLLPARSGAECGQPPTVATSSDCDSSAASGQTSQHSDAVIQVEVL